MRIFRNARILDASRGLDLASGDLWIDAGRIRAVEPAGKIPKGSASEEKDCSGLWILPGLVDAHVHLREPGFEHKETIASGTRGGSTPVWLFRMANRASGAANFARLSMAIRFMGMGPFANVLEYRNRWAMTARHRARYGGMP